MSERYTLIKQARALFKVQVQQFHDEDNKIDYKEFWDKYGNYYDKIAGYMNLINNFDENKIVAYSNFYEVPICDEERELIGDSYVHLINNYPNKIWYMYENEFCKSQHPKNYFMLQVNLLIGFTGLKATFMDNVSSFLSPATEAYIEIALTEYCNYCKNKDTYTYKGIVNVQNPSVSNPIETEKIVWNGTQKELAELFIELKRKGFINNWNIKTLKTCFTESNTIEQVLKPNQDPITYENTYEQIYTPKYKPKFHGIIKREKSNISPTNKKK